MDFKLIDTNTTEVGREEEQQTEEETYEDIQQGKTKPTISIENTARKLWTFDCLNKVNTENFQVPNFQVHTNLCISTILHKHAQLAEYHPVHSRNASISSSPKEACTTQASASGKHLATLLRMTLRPEASR